LELDGEYQFDAGSEVPALINLSKLSTEAGYGVALTPTTLLKTIAQDAQLPRPAHLDEPGPMRF
jgi:predicted amidohydrolase